MSEPFASSSPERTPQVIPAPACTMGNCLAGFQASKKQTELLEQLVESQKKQEIRDAKLQELIFKQMHEADTDTDEDNNSSTTDASSKKAVKRTNKHQGHKMGLDNMVVQALLKGVEQLTKKLDKLDGLED